MQDDFDHRPNRLYAKRMKQEGDATMNSAEQSVHHRVKTENSQQLGNMRQVEETKVPKRPSTITTAGNFWQMSYKRTYSMQPKDPGCFKSEFPWEKESK